MGFFDKLKEQASGVSAQLQDTLKGSKFASQLNTLQNTRKQQASDLGEAVLNMYRAGDLDQAALQAQVQQVFETERQIIATQEQIEAERQAAAEAKLAQQQTRQAMAPAAPAPPQASSAVRTCPNCGAAIEDPNAKFCPGCGKPI